MLIEAPFKISVVEKADPESKELHLTFTEQFSSSELSERVNIVKGYLSELNNNLQKFPADSKDKQGMMLVEQLVGELLPHITNDELELEETIVVEINKELGIASLIESSLLN
jgi:hypothetical protein